MHIMAPLTCVSEVEPLIDAGADELYCGILPSEWKSRFSAMGAPNCRTSQKANFSSLNDLKLAVDLAKARGVPVFLVVNSQSFSKSQFPMLIELAGNAADAGVSALILADPVAMGHIADSGIPIGLHASTLGTIFNSKAVEFFKGLGASRVVLPKETTLGEISAVTKGSSGIEIESFVLNGLCHNMEGFCSFQHRMPESSVLGWPSPLHESATQVFGRLPRRVSSFLLSRTRLKGCSGCILPYSVRRISGSSGAAFSAACSGPEIGLYLDACGVCAIPDLIDIGVCAFKFTGRLFSSEKKLSDLAFIRSCLDFALTGPSRADFRRFAIGKYSESHGFPCGKSKCYPSVEAR